MGLITVSPMMAQEDTINFSKAGIYGVGEQSTLLVDSARDNRELTVLVWYPTEPPERQKSVIVPEKEAPVYDGGAPYPLVIFSVGACLDASNTNKIAPQLVSHGFVVLSAQHEPAVELTQCGDDDPASIVNRPMDISFMLDEIEAGNLLDMSSLIDLERVGVAGYSYGAYAAVVSGGAHVDRYALAEFCDESTARLCPRLLGVWDDVVALYESVGTTDENGLWVDLTDDRIDVLAATAPCYFPLMNVDTMENPMLLFSVNKDEMCPSELHAQPLFEQSPVVERYWLHWTGRISAPGWPQHLVFYNERDVVNPVAAIETAFFYSHLVEDVDFVSQIEMILSDDHKWDIYIGA